MKLLLDMHSSVYFLFLVGLVMMLLLATRLKDCGNGARILYCCLALALLYHASCTIVGEFRRAHYRHETEDAVRQLTVSRHSVVIDGHVLNNPSDITSQLLDMAPQPARARPRADVKLTIEIRSRDAEMVLGAYQDHKRKTRFWVRGPGHFAPFAGMIESTELHDLIIKKRSNAKP